MRTVSFVERLELKVAGNLFSHAVCLGDVDNDGLNELVVGTASGQLMVYKGIESRAAWRQADGLGLITCVGVGDIFCSGRQHLVCVNGEGHCYVFDPQHNVPDPRPADKVLRMLPVYVQQLPSNSCVLLLDDIVGDGDCSLVVGFTDRLVRAYRWQTGSHNVTAQSKLEGEVTVEKPHERQLTQFQGWSFEGQVSSLSVCFPIDSSHPQLVVSQPGGRYALLDCTHHALPHVSERPSVNDCITVPPLCYRLSPSKRYPEAMTEVVADLQKGVDSTSSAQSDLIALSSMDGCLKFLDNNKVVWELQLDNQLFSIAKLDITGDGADEVVVCAWDGLTYIVDRHADFVKFDFEEKVSAFHAGLFGVPGLENVPCLVYATLSGKIVLFHDIALASIRTSNLLNVMAERVDQLHFLPKEEQRAVSEKDGRHLSKLFSWCFTVAESDAQAQLSRLQEQAKSLGIDPTEKLSERKADDIQIT